MKTHPLHRLGFEALPPSLTDLGFEPAMTVGATEPVSGRKVVQPTRNPVLNQALATEAMPAYERTLEEIVRPIEGATLAASRTRKNPSRLAEKIGKEQSRRDGTIWSPARQCREGQPAETVSDYGAAQIAVESVRAKDAVVAAVKQHFKVLRVQDHFVYGDPQYHYRSYSLQLQMPNGASEELQIVPRPVFQANREEHHDYKRARNAEIARPAAKRGAEAAAAAARDLNDRAMERFHAKNKAHPSVVKGAVVKGSRVKLADGAVARVVYVDPNMRIARVRTEDGRNLTVRHKDLRQP